MYLVATSITILFDFLQRCARVLIRSSYEFYMQYYEYTKNLSQPEVSKL